MPKYKGIAIIVTNETEFNFVKQFLTPEILYLNWHENLKLRETAIVLKANKNSDYSSGVVGCAEGMREEGINTLPFTENLIQYII